MAEAKSPNWDNFLVFDHKIKAMGYRRINTRDWVKDAFRLEKELPRKKKGKEVGYRYFSNGYTVVIWTTALEPEQKLRDIGEDAGWVIIIQGDFLRYSARPFSRTKGFFKKLYDYAMVSKEKIDNRPLCPCDDCRRMMRIYRRPKSRQYMWRCENREKHARAIVLSWDYGISKESKEFLKIRRDDTVRYKKKLAKEGKTVVPKAVTRKTAKIGRPDNLTTS